MNSDAPILDERETALRSGMTFAEIGAALGISAHLACVTYTRALRKLRKRPESLAKLKSLAAELQKQRREPYE